MKSDVLIKVYKWHCPLCQRHGSKFIARYRSLVGFKNHLKDFHGRVKVEAGFEMMRTKQEKNGHYSLVPMDYNVRKNNFIYSLHIEDDIDEEEKEGDIII